jgi:dodecin
MLGIARPIPALALGLKDPGWGYELCKHCREHLLLLHAEQEDDRPDSVYKVIELVGTSNDSWEKAAANAVEQAAKSLRNLRIAEVVKLDMQLDDKGKVEAYRAKLNVSFKFEGS